MQAKCPGLHLLPASCLLTPLKRRETKLEINSRWHFPEYSCIAMAQEIALAGGPVTDGEYQVVAIGKGPLSTLPSPSSASLNYHGDCKVPPMAELVFQQLGKL